MSMPSLQMDAQNTDALPPTPDILIIILNKLQSERGSSSKTFESTIQTYLVTWKWLANKLQRWLREIWWSLAKSGLETASVEVSNFNTAAAALHARRLSEFL